MIEKFWVNPYGNNQLHTQISANKNYIAILFQQNPDVANIVIFDKEKKTKQPFTQIGNQNFGNNQYHINGICLEFDTRTKSSFIHIFYQSE